MEQVRLGMIGMGEAGFNIARGLKREGLSGIVAYDKYSEIEPQGSLVRKRASEAGVVLAGSLEEMIQSSDFVMSMVSAAVALGLASEAEPYLQPGQCYIDLNASSPMTKEAVAAVIAKTGASFVDAAIMGPVPNYGHKVPIMACGDGARRFTNVFCPYGMDITYFGERAGSASALKMFRSIFMKGFVMLLMESVISGHRYGVEEQVLASIEETLTEGKTIRETITGLMTRAVIHSERREHEMDEVIATLENLHLDYIMSSASKHKLRWCTDLRFREHFGGVPPKTLEEILTAYTRLAAQG